MELQPVLDPLATASLFVLTNAFAACETLAELPDEDEEGTMGTLHPCSLVDLLEEGFCCLTPEAVMAEEVAVEVEAEVERVSASIADEDALRR